MSTILEILAICCIVGLLTNKIALNIIFVMSLLITLYGIVSLLQKDKLTDVGIMVMVIGVISLVYTICELFLGINIKTILGF